MRRNNGWRRAGVSLLVLLAAGAARATLLVQEGFNYPIITTIDGTQTGGTGFAAASSWGTAGGGVVAGLSYVGLTASGSNAFKKAGYGRVGGRNLSPSFGGSTFYLSMVINTAGSTDNRFGVEMNSGSGSCFGRVAGGWGLLTGGGGYGGILSTNGDYKTWLGVAGTADSASHLVVYKFDYTANAIKLYVDPLPAVGEPAVPSATLATGGEWQINLPGSASWTSISLFSESSNELIDELRIGTTWADVAPADPLATGPDAWWTNVTASAGASWGDSNNWVNLAAANVLPGPGSANLTVGGPSYAALYDSTQPAISNLTMQNTAPNVASLLISAPLTSLGGAAIRLRGGSSVTVTNGGIWNYVGTNAVTDINESMLSIRNGGELNVNGGVIAFTNLPITTTAYGNHINVGYLSAGTLRLQAGRLDYYEILPRAKTNDNRNLLVGYGPGGNGRLEVSGGTLTLGKALGSAGNDPLQVGVGNGSGLCTGTVVVSSGAILYTNANALMVGYNFGVGTFIVTNTGFVGGGVSGNGLNRAVIGRSPCGRGLLRMDGGNMRIADGLTVGNGGGNGANDWATGVVEVTSGTLDTGNGLNVGWSNNGVTYSGVGIINIRGGTVLETYYGVALGFVQTGGRSIGYLNITNGLLKITGNNGSLGSSASRWDVDGLTLGVAWYTDSNANSVGQGFATVSGSAVISNAGVLAIGVNGSTGTLTQTGGTIVHVPSYNTFHTLIGYGNCTVPAAHGGGYGTYTLSGGSYTTPNRVYVGGVPTSVQSYSVTGGVGLLKVSGGTFTVNNNMLTLGGNGAGKLVIGSNGVCAVKDLILTNNTQSTLRCELGANGLGTLTASGALNIYPGAKLEVDTTAYTGGEARIKLVDCVTRSGSFDPANITVTGKGYVRQDEADIYLQFQRGTMLMVR